jgi:hypothetical protein
MDDITAEWAVKVKPLPHKAVVSRKKDRIETTSIHVAIIYGLCSKMPSDDPLRCIDVLSTILEHWVPEISVVKKDDIPTLSETIEKTITLLQIEHGLYPLCALSEQDMKKVAARIDRACTEHAIHLLENRPIGGVVGGPAIKEKELKNLKTRMAAPKTDETENNRKFLEMHTIF